MPRFVQNLHELQQLAGQIAQSLGGADVLLLSGPLGAGKTTFVQALAAALGVTEKVNSPSYTIAAEYPLPAGRQVVPNRLPITTLVHVDLYRLAENSAASDPAVRDVLERASEPGRLTVIEWAERLGEKVPEQGQWIRFEHGGLASERVVTVE